jgi:DNA repair protein RadC
MTKRIKEAGELFEISLLDHLIVSADDAYFSFADEGMLF